MKYQAITSVEEAVAFFKELHDVGVNQKYLDYLPYSFHLDMVDAQNKRFSYLLTKEERRICNITSYGHNSIEDGRLTFNDLVTMFDEIIATIIFRCTDYTGRTREERKPLQLYKDLAAEPLAVYTKLCDIIANSLVSFMSNSSMFKKYKDEYYRKVKPYLLPGNERFKDMFDTLEQIYKLADKNKT